MKAARKLQTPKFGNTDVAGDMGIGQRKRIAMGMQGPTSTTKNPGSKGDRTPGMKKS